MNASDPNLPHPDLSIITVTWNDRDGLARTLRSVKAQALPKDLALEVIVIDGASTDGTTELLEGSQPVKQFAWTSEPDRGVYDAMNKGILRATGNYLHFLNSGDELAHPNALAEIWSVVRGAHAQPPLVVFGALDMAGGRGPATVIRNRPHRWFPHAMGIRPHCHQATWFGADAVRAAGGYSLEADFAGDFDLILRCGLLGPTLDVDGVQVHYENGGISEQGRDRIPELLHRIRVRRLSLPRWASAADLAFARALSIYQRVATWRASRGAR